MRKDAKIYNYDEYYNLYVIQKLTTKEIGKLKNVSNVIIQKILKRLGIPRRQAKEHQRKYDLNHNFFEKIDCEEKAYWLGFLYADGCVKQEKIYNRYRIELTQIKKYIIEQFVKSLDSNYEIKQYVMGNSSFKKKDGTKSIYYKACLSSEKLAEDLIKLGCFPRKSLVLKFPTEDQVPNDLIHHFIRGYFDGDGSVFIQKSIRYYKTHTALSHYLNISICGTKEFLEGLHKKLNFIESNAHIIHKEERKITNCYNLKLTSTKRCELFKNFIYKDATIFMKEKRETFRDYNENYFKKVDWIVRSE